MNAGTSVGVGAAVGVSVNLSCITSSEEDVAGDELEPYALQTPRTSGASTVAEIRRDGRSPPNDTCVESWMQRVDQLVAPAPNGYGSTRQHGRDRPA
jgi:hypothetical protein